MKFNGNRLLRKVASIVGSEVNCEPCDKWRDDGWVFVGDAAGGVTRFTLTTQGGSRIDVFIVGLQKPFSVGVENATGRFASLESQVRRAILEVVGDARHSDERVAPTLDVGDEGDPTAST